MRNIFIGFLFGFTLATILVLYGTDAQVKELEATNDFLERKLKEMKK